MNKSCIEGCKNSLKHRAESEKIAIALLFDAFICRSTLSRKP